MQVHQFNNSQISRNNTNSMIRDAQKIADHKIKWILKICFIISIPLFAWYILLANAISTKGFLLAQAKQEQEELVQKIEVTEAPLTAEISADVISGVAPLEVSFDASGSKSNNERIINYVWKFPKTDPINATAQIAREFDVPGVYPVMLEIITESGKSATAETLISVLASPVKSMIKSNLSYGKAPLIVKFDGSDSVGDILDWKWDFGDNITSTEINPSHRYSSPGIYTAKLRVKDSKGLLDTMQVQIVVE